MRSPIYNAVLANQDAYCDWKVAQCNYLVVSKRLFQDKNILSYWTFLKSKRADMKLAKLKCDEAKAALDASWVALLNEVKHSE
jgi:hypothetical protein